jgi:hypothetical protein
MTDFHGTWYERYTTEDHLKAAILHFINLVIITPRTHEIMMWELHWLHLAKSLGMMYRNKSLNNFLLLLR